MAEHKVKFEIPQSELGKTAAEFKAYRNGNVIGTLKIRKGGIEWLPK